MSDANARLFVAFELPEPVREMLVSWRSAVLAPLPTLRMVPPAALHLTLCFLGSRPAAEIGPIVAACASLPQLAPSGLTLAGPIWLPRRRPGVVGITIADPRRQLTAMQASVAARLRAGGWYEPESRPFLPHVTVARVPRGTPIRAVELPTPDPLALDGARLTLFRSHLGRAGARYEALSA